MSTLNKTSVVLSLAYTIFSSISANAQETKPYKAKEIEVYKGQEIKPTGKKQGQVARDGKQEVSYFFGLYNYWVPGTSYTVPDYTNKTEVLRTSAGTGVLPGSIRIDGNGSYTWNSSWDGKIIKGSWRITGDSDYPIELMKAQEGKNWKIGKSNDEGVAIIVWNGSTWYNGKRIKGGK